MKTLRYLIPFFLLVNFYNLSYADSSGYTKSVISDSGGEKATVTNERLDVNTSDISGVTYISSVTEVLNVTSLDTVDMVTYVSGVTNIVSLDTIDTVTEVTNVTSVDIVDAVTSITDPVTIADDTPTDLVGGFQSIVLSGTTYEVLYNGDTKKIFIENYYTNTGTVFVGKYNVYYNSNCIFRLLPGDIVYFDYDDSVNPLYMMSDKTNQMIYTGALLK